MKKEDIKRRAGYVNKISKMNEEELYSETYDMMYHSARCSSNPKACWHWMVDACYDECQHREGDIYKRAWDCCYSDHCG